MKKDRNFRFIQSLTEHEIEELDVDFDIQVNGYFALVPITKKEFQTIFECVEKVTECSRHAKK